MQCNVISCNVIIHQRTLRASSALLDPFQNVSLLLLIKQLKSTKYQVAISTFHILLELMAETEPFEEKQISYPGGLWIKNELHKNIFPGSRIGSSSCIALGAFLEPLSGSSNCIALRRCLLGASFHHFPAEIVCTPALVPTEEQEGTRKPFFQSRSGKESVMIILPSAVALESVSSDLKVSWEEARLPDEPLSTVPLSFERH